MAGMTPDFSRLKSSHTARLLLLVIPAFGLACATEALVADGPTRDPVITPGAADPAAQGGSAGGYYGGYAPDDE
jgi:hypothetical protein